jgi:hypothetical protein
MISPLLNNSLIQFARILEEPHACCVRDAVLLWLSRFSVRNAGHGKRNVLDVPVLQHGTIERCGW